MKARQLMGAAMVAFTFVAGACVVAWNPQCDNISTLCPNGSGHDAVCTSTDSKQSNNDVGSRSGYDPVASSGKCNYTCYWTNGFGNSVNCGTNSVSWNDTKPGTTQCPHTSGSGS